VLAGDREMLTSVRIREEVELAEFDWISCLRSDAIQKLPAGEPQRARVGIRNCSCWSPMACIGEWFERIV
jgi:hypothetical protein